MSYKNYRFVITNKRNLANFVSYSEVKLFGYPNRYLLGKLNDIVYSFIRIDQLIYCECGGRF